MDEEGALLPQVDVTSTASSNLLLQQSHAGTARGGRVRTTVKVLGAADMKLTAATLFDGGKKKTSKRKRNVKESAATTAAVGMEVEACRWA